MKYEVELTEILIELTDTLGYDFKNEEHFDAYKNAFDKITNLIELSAEQA